MDNFNVNPDDLTYEPSYPSPPESNIAKPTKKRKSSPTESSQSEQSRKKRKAWGQPVPEIVPILPPRKRAKTAEEKEQRKNERILRNRRAADKSRQRQKAAVADLERRQGAIEEENITLKAMLEQYRSKFGELDGFSFPTTPATVKSEPSPEQSAPSPVSVDSDFSHTSLASTPAMAPNSPMLVADNKSLPPLTENLFPSDSSIPNFRMDEMTLNGFESSVSSGLTQYPAAILCDLQCQPEDTSLPTHSQQSFHNFIQFLAQLNLQWMIYGTFWTTTLSPLYQIYQILVGSSPPTSTIHTISNILANKHFNLILGLIFPPSPTTLPQTTRNVFRMKLLSRLLTCSPKMARLLLAATDRELRVVVDDADFADDAALRGQWAKMITLKWMIVRLEVEHGRYRRLTEEERGMYVTMEGVDYVGIQRNLGRWRLSEPEPALCGREYSVNAVVTDKAPATAELKVY